MSAIEVLVGVDIGTSSCKAVVTALSGTIHATAWRPTPWHRADGRAELHPDTIVSTVRAVVTDALAHAGSATTVRAIGLTGMAEAGALADRDGTPIGVIIGWQDARGGAEAQAMAHHFGDEFEAHTGRHSTALVSASKIAWLRANGVTGESWMSVVEWVARCLGAERVAEPSLASRTGLLDVVTGGWWPAMLDYLGLPGQHRIELRPATASAGTVANELPGATGAVISIGGHDHLVASVGADAVRPGTVFDSCGTAESFVTAVEQPSREAIAALVDRGGSVSRHVVPGLSAAFAPPHQTGAALSRVLAGLGIDERDAQAMAQLRLDASRAEADHGIRPLDEPPASGAPAAVIWRTAIEDAVAIGEARMSELRGLAGSPSSVVASGGWLDDLVVDAKRRRLGLPVRAFPGSSAGASGAAMLAGVAAGIYESVGTVPRSTAGASPAHERS